MIWPWIEMRQEERQRERNEMVRDRGRQWENAGCMARRMEGWKARRIEGVTHQGCIHES